MAGRRASFKQSDVTRALRAAREAGFKPRGFSVHPDTGAILVQFDDSNPVNGNSFDALLGGQR